LEIEKFSKTEESNRQMRKELAERNIYWYPVRWQTGNSILDKISSILPALLTGAKICYRHRPRLIHSRSSLTTFLSVPLAKIFRIPFLYDADSILSEEYLDTKHLSSESKGFKLLAKSEAKARASAVQIIVLTEKLKQDYQQKFSVKTPIEVIPCCVDTENFKFDEKLRVSRRRSLGLADETLFTYVGKYGSWYLVDETIDFFGAALKTNPEAKLLIVTQDTEETFHRILAEKRIPQSSYFIRRAAHCEVAGWLSAADAGLAFIKPLPSKRGSSPVKTSEYLACGLPVVSNSGVGDLEAVVETTNSGVILREFNAESYREAFEKLTALLQNENLRENCRKAARAHFDLEKVGGARYRRLYRELLSPK
jgi:glycosyltransferase involved in cell wall biosynthesis